MTWPQQPPQPYYPPQPQAPQQPYYPPQGQQYPPQPQAYYPPPPQPSYEPPAAPVPHGSIDDFYNQPVGSGKSLTFDKKPVGFTYQGVVSRTITPADIQAQTDMRDRRIILKHPDGRIKYVMIVPLQMSPSVEFPDGRAAWYVKGADRTELESAMERAGCKPGTPPEMGAVITIRYTGERPIPGLNPQKMKQVTYQRPNGAQADPVPGIPATAPAMQAPAPENGHGQPYVQYGPDGQPLSTPASIQEPNWQAQPQFQQPQQPPVQYAQAQQAPPQYAPPQYLAQPQFQAPQYEQPAQAPAPAPYQPGPAPQQPQYAQAPEAAAAPAQSGPQVPPDLSAEQLALLSRLTSQ